MQNSFKKLAALVLLTGTITAAFAQAGGTTEPTKPVSGTTGDAGKSGQSSDIPQNVSIAAKGTDVRDVLTDLFKQVKQNVVLRPGIHFVLYLNLQNVPFDEVLGIICDQANLQSNKIDGITYIETAPNKPKASVVKKPMVLDSDLKSKIVTVKSYKAELKTVLQKLSDQTGIPFVIDPSVPNYKMDIVLLKTSLKYALDQLSSAAHLQFQLGAGEITVISQPVNKVALVNP